VFRQLVTGRIGFEPTEADGKRIYRYRGTFTNGGLFEGTIVLKRWRPKTLRVGTRSPSSSRPCVGCEMQSGRLRERAGSLLTNRVFVSPQPDWNY